MIQGSVGRESVAATFRILRKIDPESVRELRKELQGDLKPVGKAIAAKYPSQAYLSGLEGYTRIKYDPSSGQIVSKENWKWSQVVSKVNITPGKSRKGPGLNNLVSISINFKGAIPWVTEFAKVDSAPTPQGRALVRNIEKRFPSWPNGGRIFYKEFLSTRSQVISSTENILNRWSDQVSEELK